MKVSDALKKYSLTAQKYTKNGNTYIIDTDSGKYAYKSKNINKEIYNYLKSRNFDYFPKLVSNIDEDFYLTEYAFDYGLPPDQKALDLIRLAALLHSKTTHYKEVDNAYYDELYSDLDGNIDYLYSYYSDLISVIESKVFMSPSEYLLARNISVIFEDLDFCKKNLEEWKDIVKDKNKVRYSVVHNNLRIDHFLNGEEKKLISWDKSKVDNPVFDLYVFYRNHSLDFDFESLFKEYERMYPLKKEERLLLYILISLPNILDLDKNEYNRCFEISNMIDTIYKGRSFIKIV